MLIECPEERLVTLTCLPRLPLSADLPRAAGQGGAEHPCGGAGTPGTAAPLDGIHCLSHGHTRALLQPRLNLSLSSSADTGPETQQKAKKRKEKRKGSGKGEGGQALLYCSFIPLHSITPRQ